MWQVLVTEVYEQWFLSLSGAEQIEVQALVEVLEIKGPSFSRPYADVIHGTQTMKNLKELRQQMTPEVRAAAKVKAVEIITEMSLAETRKARGVNQTELAKRLAISQPNISQIESRPDLLISTLEHYISALGGKLELHAKFPDGQDVEITRMFKS